MNTYRKIGNDWLVACTTQHPPGTEVEVSLKSGNSKRVRLGALHSVNVRQGLFYFAEAEKPRPAAVAIGSLAGILALFDKAREHLKFPAIVLGLAGLPAGIRISVAGERARFPGSLNVNSGEKGGGEYGREWYGRIMRDGSYEPSRNTFAALSQAIAERLREFAADPAKVAGEHGRLTGRCCFCNQALSDERSTAVGYGAICASHFGLPWGAKPAEFAAQPEREVA